MVRSKFPGKPSKFNNRKLVKVSNFVAATNQENESAIAPELYICFGLSVFNNAFERKDNNTEKDEGAPFHGFSPEEIAATKKEAILRIAEIEKEYKNRGAAFLPLDKKLGSKSLILPESFVGKDDNDCKNSGTVSVVNKETDRSARSNNIDGDTPQYKRKKQKTSDCDSKPLKKSSSNNYKSNNKNSGAGLSKIECGVTTAGNYLSREKSIVNGSPNVTSAFYSRKNFVLPSHSGYSSRVIKPNKRFLADGTRRDGAESTVGSSSGSNSCNSSITSGCDFNEPNDSSSANEQTSSSTTSSVTGGTGGGIKLKKSRLVLAHTDPNITWAKSRDDKTNIVSDVESETSSLKSCCSSSVTSGSSSNNSIQMLRPPPPKKKIILRKSRLNVDSVHDLLRLRPPLNTVCLATGKIICGVCGSTRYYRFVKQARKFGIYCCEPCRKFISKCIHACSSLKALKCIEGRGNCTVPPMLKTVVWDTTRKMNGKKGKVRCQACWLKLCIRRFCMPDYLNYRLNQMLPPLMKDPFLVAPTSKFTLSTSRKTTGIKSDGGAKGKTGAGGSVPKEEKVGGEGKERVRETIKMKKRRRSQLSEREKIISLRQARLQERLRRKQLGRNARKGDEVNRKLRSSSTNTNRMRKRTGAGSDVVSRASSSSVNKKRNASDDVSQDDDDEDNEDCDVGGHNDDNDDDDEDDDNDDDNNKKTKVRGDIVDVKQEESGSSSGESDDHSSTGSSGGGGTSSNGGKCDEESEGNHKRRKLLSPDHSTMSKGKLNSPSTSCADACGTTQVAEKKCNKRRNNVKSRRQFVNDRKLMESRNEKQLKHRQRRKRRRRRNRRNREKGSSDELEHDDESNMTAASSVTDGCRRTVKHKSQPLVPPSSSGGKAQHPTSDTTVPVTKLTEPLLTGNDGTMVPPSSGPIEVKKRRRRKADDILLIGIMRDEIRHKRKAALNSLANIARVTGRITDSPVVENQLIVARNLKKRAAAIARRDTTCAISAVPNSKKLADGVGGIKRKRNQPLNEGAAGFCRRTKLTAVVGDTLVTTNSGRGRNTAGPRVKHVCRSASLVLGRQVATFPSNNNNGGTKSMSMDLKELPGLGESLSSSSPCDRSNASGVDCGSTGALSSSQFVDGNIGNGRSCCGEPSSSPLPPPLLPPPAPSANNSLATSGRIRQPSSGGATTDAFSSSNRRIDEDSSVETVEKIKPKTYARNLQDLGRQNCELLDGIVRQSEDKSVSIDFWESYDPDEVCKTGFALIGYDPSITVQSLCYLCGSAGEDQLIHCACCCEPYHLFCVEGGLKEKKRPLDSWWRVDWVCPRCAICTACGQGDGHQVNCNRCHKSYHSDCMPHHKIANRVHSADRPLVCHSCLRCKSCNGECVSVFVGNMSLCSKCFKRRQDGNYCPICQKSYDANDYNTFMMECGRCKCWIHSDCERLLDEQYHVLSTLPDTVEFICRLCCDSDRPPWRLAVDSELNNKYLQVIKSLTKNRKVCELLKCSPKKQPSLMCTCSNKLAVNSPAARNVTDQIVSLSNQNLELLAAQNVGSCSGRVQEMLSVIGRNKNLNDSSSSSSLLFSFLLSSSSPLEMTEEGKSDECCLSSAIKKSSFSLSMKKEMKPNKLNLVNVSNSNSSNSSSNSSSSTNERDNKIDEPPSHNPSEELHIKLSDQDQPLLSAIQPYQNLVEGKPAQFSPHTSQSDSGIGSTDDELKPPLSNSDNEISSVIAPVMKDVSSVKCSLCSCRRSELIMKSPPQLLIDIKNKINGNKYLSLQDFHRDTQKVIELIDDKKLFDIYYQILNGAFPWFDPVDSEVTASADEDFNMSFDSNTMGDVGKFDISDHSEATSIADGKREEKSMVTTSVLKDQLGKSRSYYYCTINFHDTRVCVLCKMIGDCCLEDQGRLLYCGHNEWIHANCALWSNEVFEEIDGSLQRVHSAISRSRLIRCAKCNKRGASVGCCYRNCPESFHFLCAKDADCVFMEDKSIYCYAHQNESKSKPLNEESDFAIMRPIYVELIELEKKKKKSNIPHQQIRIMIGSLMIESLGEFVADVSDKEVSIIPCEFVCTRLYWSYKEPWRLMRYRIRTKILQVAQDYFIEEEDNKTVDHSQDIKSELRTCEDDLKMGNRNLNFPVDSVDIKQVLTNLLDSVCDSGNSKSVSDISLNEPMREMDDEEEVEDDKVDEIFGNFTDPQNPVDVLLPELLEGICEAVKHDIVGMSVEDDVINPIMNDGDFCDDGDTTGTATSVHSKSSSNTTVPFKPLSGGNKTESKSKDEVKNPDSNVDNTFKLNTLLKTGCASNTDSNEKPKAVVKPDIINKRILPTNNKVDCNFDTGDGMEKVKFYDDQNSRILQVDGALDCSSSDSNSDIGSPGCRSSDSEVVKESSACNSVLLVTIKDTMKDEGSKFENTEEKKFPKKADVDLIQVDGCADNISDLEDGIDCTSGTSNTPGINGWSDETNDFVIVDEDYENDFVLVNEDQEDVEYQSDKETVGDSMNCYFYYYTSPDENEMTDYDGAEWKHIPQVDGISDCISVNSNENSTNNKDKDKTEDEDQPVKCLRCHRTYRTAVSYERHLSTCNTDYMLSCSESDSSEEEKASSPLNDFGSSSSPAASNCDSVNNTGETTESATHSNNEGNQSSPSSMISSSSSTLSAESNIGDGLMIPSATITTTPLVEPNSDFCQGAEDVVEYVVQTSESTDGVQESTCINSALYKEDVEVPVNPDNNSYALAISTSNDRGEIEIPGDVTVVYAPDNIDNCILINVDNNSKMMKDSSASDLTYYITNVDDNSGQCTVIGNHNEKSVCAFIDTSRPKERKINDHQMATTAAIQQQSVVDYSQQTPTLIIQQLPSQQNVIPTYVDAYQQPATVHAQQNVQYIAIDSSDKTGQQYQTVLPNTYQIQTSSPSVQTVVPTVVGTLIQPNGVEQLVLNTTPSNPIDVFTHQPAAAYISSPPPLYMNMETVVSNTVMSSSQFVSVPGSVPGMLSTYSATTTQVFQAAAAKPVIPEVPAQSYIVINTSPATETGNTSSGIIDNGSVHHINILPQTIATTNQNHLLQSQENNQWRLTSPVVHQQSTQKQLQHQPIYKYNDKTCTGVHQIIHQNKNHERLQQTPNEPRIKTELINSCKNNSVQRNDDQLKIQQNAKKIDPVHGLSKMVENIQSAVSTNKKICLNNYPVKHKPPEAKVIPLQKANNQIFSVDQFKEKITTKKIINSFDLNKPNCYYNNKLSNKPTDDPLKKPNVMNCVTAERSKVYKNYDYDKIELLNLPDDVKCSRDVISNFLNRVSSDKPDRRKVIVQPIPSNNVQESQPIDCAINQKSDGAAMTVIENSKMRTYTNSKRKLSTISQLSQILSPQRLEEIKLQLLKESNKNSQRSNSNVTNACSSVSNSTATVKSIAVTTTVTTTAGTTCTSTNSSWCRNSSIPDSYNTQVLQPTLKENKLHDKVKSSVPDKSVENNFKRLKSADKKVTDNLLVIRKKDLLKPSSETVEKVKNSSKPQKTDKLKRKDNHSSSTVSNENLIRKLIMDSIKSSKDPLLTSNKSLISSGASANMIFQIESNEGEIVSSAENLVDAWQQLFEKVQKEKASQNLPLIPRNPYQCEKDAVLKILGLGHNSVKYVMEQLPGVGSTVKYRPTYHKNRHQFIRKSQEMKENQTGCARSEPYLARNKYDMFSWLASRHRRPPKFLETSDADMVNGNSRRATSLNLPMAMRFRHLRETSKEAVGVFRSDIHGRGLFCLRDIDSGEMVIEYAGEVIRSALTDKRERYYTSKGIGCYMFRIDDNFVVDATMKGNAARFINHSCEPNCYSRVVDILGKKHILIFALRRIPQGEELTYDYKFPLEDDKITCHCLSRKCRKYLN